MLTIFSGNFRHGIQSKSRQRHTIHNMSGCDDLNDIEERHERTRCRLARVIATVQGQIIRSYIVLTEGRGPTIETSLLLQETYFALKSW
jgi:hypothetical protein